MTSILTSTQYMQWIRAAVFVGFLGCLVFAQPSPNQDRFMGEGVNAYSPDQETELGKEAAAGLERKLAIVHEPKLDTYISTIGGELRKTLPWSPFSSGSYRFTVYDDRKLDVRSIAMAMPQDAARVPAREPIALAGGPIFVPLGLLVNSENESIFAFHLAHAMAHVALRHSTRIESRLESMRKNGNNRWPGSADSNAIFVRRCELQADSTAAGMVIRARFDVEAVVRYLDGLPAFGFGLGRVEGSQRAEAVRVEMKKMMVQVRPGGTGLFEEARRVAVRMW